MYTKQRRQKIHSTSKYLFYGTDYVNNVKKLVIQHILLIYFRFNGAS